MQCSHFGLSIMHRLNENRNKISVLVFYHSSTRFSAILICYYLDISLVYLKNGKLYGIKGFLICTSRHCYTSSFIEHDWALFYNNYDIFLLCPIIGQLCLLCEFNSTPGANS